MSRREKLLARMETNPRGIRFGAVEALLRYEGFVLFNQRGSHCTYHGPGGQVITIVRPHGRRTTCHPADIQKLLSGLYL